jgi:hypothetical protein
MYFLFLEAETNFRLHHFMCLDGFDPSLAGRLVQFKAVFDGLGIKPVFKELGTTFAAHALVCDNAILPRNDFDTDHIGKNCEFLIHPIHN